MIKVNGVGRLFIEEFLKTRAKPSAWDNPRFQSLVESAHKGSDFRIVLDARFAINGSTEVYTIPPEGFALHMQWKEFNTFANSAVWTSIDQSSWGVAMQAGGDDSDEDNRAASNGFNQLGRETSALHPSGKRITVTYECDSIYKDSGGNSQIAVQMSAGTWFVDGLTLIGPKGAPLTYQAMHTLFEGCAGRFGHRSGRFATDMRTIDASKLVPNSGGVTEVDMDKEDDLAPEKRTP